MTQLTAIHAKITGDSSSLVNATNKADAALKRTATAAGGLQRPMTQIQGSSRLAGNSMRMLSMQLSQVGQQAMVTGNIAGALAVQLPDIGLAFGTIGTAAGLLAGIALPMVVKAFSDGAGGASDFEDSLKQLKQMTSDLEAVQDILAMSAAELGKVYGDSAEMVREFARAEAALKIAEITTLMQRQRDAILANASAYRQTAAARFGVDAQVQKIADAFQTSDEQAKMFRDELMALGEDQSLEEQKNRMWEFLRALEAAGVPLANVPEELRAALNEMILLNRQASILERLMVSFADGSSPRTGGGAARRDPVRGQLESLQRQLATETETIQNEYAERQRILEEALQKKYITEQEYNDLTKRAAREHADELNKIEMSRHSTQLKDQASFFGSLASIAQAGGDKLLRVAKAFSAAQATINAWEAYSAMLKDPAFIGRPWARFAAAANVLSAGLGAVSAIRGTGQGGSTSTAAGGAAAQSASLPNVNIQLTGSTFNRDQVQQLIEQIGEAFSDGARIRVA